MGGPNQCNEAREKNKSYKVWKEWSKASLFMDNRIIYIVKFEWIYKDSKLISEFSNDPGYKMNIKKNQLYFYILALHAKKVKFNKYQ